MFKIQPIDMIAAPNSWAPIKDGVWTVVDPNPTTLWFQVLVVDSLGTRPYATATGASLSVTFRRADLIEQDPQRKLARTAQSLTKTATFNAQNRSIGSIALTTQDVQKLTSGAAFFSFVESGTTTQWIQDWLVKRVLTSQGF
jgi:hypothetical protein